MRPPEEEIRLLVGEWIKKADLDFKTVVRLSAEGEFRDVVGFHAQQAAEKYLKALLTRHRSSSRRRTSSGGCSFCWSRLIQRWSMPLMMRIG